MAVTMTQKYKNRDWDCWWIKLIKKLLKKNE